jgi:lipopolysaccharide/colanic/teichoic acid biosynthesis glycosyltransferase
VTVTPDEDAADKTARLAQEAKDATVRRLKEIVLFFVALVGVVLLLAGCAWIAFGMRMDDKGFHLFSAPSADDRKWAMSILTAGIGGLIGYLVKGSSK